MSGSRLWRELREQGFTGGYSTVTDFLRTARPAGAPAPFECRFETPPGRQAQADFAFFRVRFETEPGTERIVWLFWLMLGHSRMLWARFASWRWAPAAGYGVRYLGLRWTGSAEARACNGWAGILVSLRLHANLASWLNAVEGFFAELTKQRLRRGVFHSLVALQAAIKRYLAEANVRPRPFQWTKDPDKIIAAVRRGHHALDSFHNRKI